MPTHSAQDATEKFHGIYQPVLPSEFVNKLTLEREAEGVCRKMRDYLNIATEPSGNILPCLATIL